MTLPKEFKVRTYNPQLSEQIQIAAFRLGYSWHGVLTPSFIEVPFLYFYKDMRIGLGYLGHTFLQQVSPEVSPHDIISAAENLLKPDELEEAIRDFGCHEPKVRKLIAILDKRYRRVEE